VQAVSSDHEVEPVGLGVLVNRHREPLPVSVGNPPTHVDGSRCAARRRAPADVDATGFDVAGEANRSTMAAERRGR
jgi:hypothetical protein